MPVGLDIRWPTKRVGSLLEQNALLNYCRREVDIKELSLGPIGEDNHLGTRIAEKRRLSSFAYHLLKERGVRFDLAPCALLLDGTPNLRSHEA